MNRDRTSAPYSSNPNNLRHMYHIAIGIRKELLPPYKLEDISREIQDCITRIIGGSTAWISEGTWSAFSQQGDYSGKIERDITLNFFLTMTIPEKKRAWPQVQKTIADAALKHGIGCEHIHVITWLAESSIFRVSDVALSPANENLSPYELDSFSAKRPA